MFPSPSLTPPTLEAFQWSYNSLTMGANTPFGVLQVEGMNMAALRSGDVNKPRDHGQLKGLDVYGGQDIILDLWMKAAGEHTGPPIATNLIPDPSFEYDTVGSTAPPGWVLSAGYTTKAVQEGWAASGKKSLRLTAPADASERVALVKVAGVAGRIYTGLATWNILSIAAGKEVLVLLEFKNEALALLSSAIGTVATGAGVLKATVTATAPPETAHVTMVVATAGGSGAVDMYLDAVLLSEGETSTYFDGDSPNAEWTGTPGDSSSELFGPSSLQASQLELAAATVAQPSEDQPLWFQLPNMPLLCIMCRPRKRPMKIDSDYAAAQVGKPELSLHAEDPRFYGAGQAVTLTLATPTGGLAFPVGFPVTFSSLTPSTAVVVNGNTEMRPVVVFSGPLTNPTIENSSIDDEPFLKVVNPEETEYTVAAGDQILLNLDTPHLAQYYKGGVTSGNEPTDIMEWLTVSSTWWNLLPGSNTIRFYSNDATNTGGSATIQWAPAYML